MINETDIKSEIRNYELQLEERDLTGSDAQFYKDVEKRLIILRNKLKSKGEKK